MDMSLNHDFSINPSTNLNEYLDAFDSGDSLERQGLMIAKRIKHLIEGKPVRVKSSNGDWDILPTCEKVLQAKSWFYYLQEEILET